MSTSSRVFTITAAALPLLSAALWMVSGRENLTKREKNVEIESIDDTFGDQITRVEPRRGPVLGYFIGLDAVAGSTAAALGIGGVAWWLGRRGARQTATREN